MTIQRAATVLLSFLAAAGLGGASPQHNPASAKPAETALPASPSITATGDGVLLDSTQHMVFFYVLHNSSSRDYEIPGDASTRLFALLAGTADNTAHELPAEQMRLRYPIIVHPHQVQIITLHDMAHSYVVDDHLKMNPTPAEYAKYEVVAKAAVRKSWPELNGFRLDVSQAAQSISFPRPF